MYVLSCCVGCCYVFRSFVDFYFVCCVRRVSCSSVFASVLSFVRPFCLCFFPSLFSSFFEELTRYIVAPSFVRLFALSLFRSFLQFVPFVRLCCSSVPLLVCFLSSFFCGLVTPFVVLVFL